MDVDMVCAMKFGEAEVPKALERVYASFRDTTVADPRAAPSHGVAWVKHIAWFASEDGKHLEVAAPPKHIASLMRFRLGCTWDLRVYDHEIPNREDRFCDACMTVRGRKMMEDEYHLIFECVRYDRLRKSLRWGSLYKPGPAGDMKTFMNQEDQGKLACFIHMLIQIRKDPRVLNQDVDCFSSGSEVEGEEILDMLEPEAT